MRTSVRFYQTLAKILEQKHKVKINLTVEMKGEKDMYNVPDHPDIVSCERTGYPRSFNCSQPREVDEDFEYESRRDEALLREEEGA